MATAVTSMKWRLQFTKAQLVQPILYYIEFTAGTLTTNDLDDLAVQLKKLGYVNIEYGLIVVLP